MHSAWARKRCNSCTRFLSNLSDSTAHLGCPNKLCMMLQHLRLQRIH